MTDDIRFPRILDLLMRDELKAICRAAGIDDSGREQAVIADRILGRADGSTRVFRAEAPSACGRIARR